MTIVSIFSELSIQPSLNAILIPRGQGGSESTNSPQDGPSSVATDGSDAPVVAAATASGMA